MSVDSVDWDVPPHGALALAVAASQSGFWFDAANLWEEQYWRGRYRSLAAFCWAEAALQSGQLGRADYALSHSSEARAALTDLSSAAEEIRELRVAWFGGEDRNAIDVREKASRETELALFQDALVSLGPLAGSDAQGRIAAKALAGLGFHDAVVETAERVGLDDDIVKASERRVAQRQQPLSEHIARFVSDHPAGPLLVAAVGEFRAAI